MGKTRNVKLASVDPATHQPTKGDLEADVSIDATPKRWRGPSRAAASRGRKGLPLPRMWRMTRR